MSTGMEFICLALLFVAWRCYENIARAVNALETPVLTPSQRAELRARNRQGQFVGDQPGTATNEAYKPGSAPRRRGRRS